jgi:hypothetical protein
MVHRSFVLTEITFKNLTGRYGVLKCHRCGGVFVEGDKIVAISDCPYKPKRYHDTPEKPCYDSIFLDSKVVV